jgi:alpha-beta hydrolase superfamily lysophospholipase
MPTFTDPFGVVVTYDVYPKVARKVAPKAIIQIAHGIGEHAGRYAELAKALVTAGFGVYVADMRGHGRTGMQQFADDTTQLGHLGAGGLKAAIGNISQLTEIIKEAHPGVPIVLLGHSMGSLLAQKLINTRASDYAAVILSASAYRMPGSMESGNLNKKFAFEGSTTHEWLSRDPKVIEAFEADPLTFDAEVLKLFGLADGLRLFGVPSYDMDQVPLLIILGSRDPLGGEKSALKLAKAYTKTAAQNDVTVTVYPDARHELFNETNRKEVIADMIAWIKSRLA